MNDRRYLIQIEKIHDAWNPRLKAFNGSLESAKKVLRGTGVRLDAGVPTDLDGVRFVFRGSASKKAKGKAEMIPGVLFFSSPRIGPV